MTKKLLIIVLFLLIISSASCSSNLPDYIIDNWDKTPIEIDGTDITNTFDIYDTNTINELSETINTDYIANSPSNSYILIFTNDVPFSHSGGWGLSGSYEFFIYQAKYDDNTCFFAFNYRLLDKDYGYKKYTISNFFAKLSCKKPSGHPQFTLYLSFMSSLFSEDISNLSFHFEHFEFNNYDKIEKPDLPGKLNSYYRPFMTNIYIKDTLVCKIGYISYNKKPTTELVENFVNTYAKIIAIEDLRNFYE